MTTDLSVLLILLLPLAGAAFNGFAGLFVPALRRHEGLFGIVGTMVVAIPFLLAAMLFVGYDGSPHVTRLFSWMAAGDLDIAFSYRIDELSLIMTLIVTGVGALIHWYSIGYMHGDESFWRFFAYLNLFIFAMLSLVLGNNLVVLFLGWEGVGLCSYLLIGFWYSDLKNSAAANKAFIVNRIGDFAFLLGMFLAFKSLGGLDFETLLSNPAAASQSTINWIVLLLFIGATGKSAQIPLFVWLPDAMAGPTPVSALIHAATMVTSGLYLLARMSPMVLLAPDIMMVIAVVGAVTALMAATIAITQNDIKKILAYSTVSQLGYMFLAAGVGAFYVSIFHVLTHAFFKACLFLGSGSVIHAMHHVEHELHERGHHGHLDPQDVRTMGGLGKYMPSTDRTFLIATLAISGIPLLSGFFSKDEILFKAFEYGYNGMPYAWLVWGIGLVTAVLTAVYMTRCYVLTFRGEERWPMADSIKPHESPASMTLPLWVLAAGSVLAGYIGLPGVIAHGELNWIHHWLSGPVAAPAEVVHGSGFMTIEWLLIALGSAIAIAGVGFAWRAYSRHGLAFDESISRRFGFLYGWWKGKYFFDEFYERTVVRAVVGGAEKVFAPFDYYFVDGIVNGVGKVTRGTGQLLRYLQTGLVQSYAAAIVLGVVLVVAIMLFG
jgi:NADH-quinone oxidoreductase subunit L